MTDFRIDVVIDPAPAIRGAKPVERQLDRLEQEAKELRAALVQALSVRDQGTATTLGRIEQILGRTEERAIITDARISRIGKDISDRGIRRVGQAIDDTTTKASALERRLKQALTIGSAIFAVRQFSLLSDEFTRMQNQLRTVVQDQTQVSETFAALNAIANKTRTEVGGIVQLYQRGSIAAKELGVSNDELLKFVDRVGQSLAVQGVSAQQASGALLQLSQALGAGVVRAEEFNSILEGAFPIAQAAAKGLDAAGGSVARLRQLIITGQVTSREFFQAFLKGSDDIEKQFEKTGSTIGQAFTVLKNNLTDAIGEFNKATGASDAVANAILLLGNNIGPVSTAVTAFSAVLLLKLVPSLTAATGATRKFILANGPVLALAAGYTALASSVSSISEEYEAAAETLRQVEEDGKAIPKLGAQIVQAQRELNNLNRLITEGKQKELSESQQARVEQLRQAIERLRGGVRQQAIDQRAAQAAAAAAAEEQKAQADAVQRQKDLLEKIRKPMQDYETLQRDLGVLLAANKITQEEFNRVLAEATPKKDDPFAAQVESLKRQNEQLEIRATKIGVTQQGLLIENDLARQGVKLDGEKRTLLAEQLLKRQELLDVIQQQEQRERAAETIAALQDRNALLRVEIEQGKEQAQVEAILGDLRKQGVKDVEQYREQIEALVLAQAQLNQQQADQRKFEALRNEIDLVGQLKQQEQDLLDLRAQHPDLIAQIDRALEDLRIRQLDASQDLAAGFERAFLKLKKEADDVAAAGEAIVNVFADRATDAVVDFVRTGRFEFREFAAALIEDLTRIIARLLIVKILSAASGVGGPPTGGPQLNPYGNGQPFGLELRQHGGPVQAGQPVIVGEREPEIFVPDRKGTVLPSVNAVQQAPPQVNITMVNVANEEQALAAMAGAAGERIVLNHIAKNPNVMRRVST